MKHWMHQHKRHLFLWLSAVLLLSGIQTKAATAYSSTRPFHTPLRSPVVQYMVSWLYHDVSTGESLGTRSVKTVLDCCTRNPGRGFCRMPDPVYMRSRPDILSYPSALTARLYRQSRETGSIPWIIRYIHDQDGEKEGRHPLI